MNGNGGLEAVEIGVGFIPGPKANREIQQMLGFMGTVPDFCNDSVASADQIEFEGFVPFVKPTVDKMRVCIFEHGGKVHVTRKFRKSSQALACVLHFLLSSNKSRVTC